uniref:hypothetical protein n=1 Tax=Pannonibacter phragmitetus TaxID=121719 RepID=UPI000B95D086|nr:hypothetical protein [Pannonibacter phragmitetus]
MKQCVQAEFKLLAKAGLEDIAPIVALLQTPAQIEHYGKAKVPLFIVGKILHSGEQLQETRGRTPGRLQIINGLSQGCKGFVCSPVLPAGSRLSAILRLCSAIPCRHRLRKISHRPRRI